jgi:DNA-directed RNA polymerase specialized sigma24 family protein
MVRYFAGKARDAAVGEDRAHDFILGWLKGQPLEGFQRLPGKRFRQYLATALCNHWAGYVEACCAAKRGGGQVPGSLDALSQRNGWEPPIEPADPGTEVDMLFALDLHWKALAQLKRDCRTATQRERFATLQPLILFEANAESRAELARRLGLSANTFQQALFRVRNDYYDAFRTAVANTVAREEIDDEMRYLIRLLPGALAEESAGSA